MALQQQQYFCQNCQKPTLHTRNTYDVPHVAHLLASVFLCGFWLPIWALHTFANAKSTVPFLCNACGTSIDDSREARWAQERQQRIEHAQQQEEAKQAALAAAEAKRLQAAIEKGKRLREEQRRHKKA